VYLLFLVSLLGSMLLLIAGVPALAGIPAVVGITNVVSVPSVAKFLNINGISLLFLVQSGPGVPSVDGMVLLAFLLLLLSQSTRYQTNILLIFLLRI
jgi:hypothetical protein